MYEAVLTAPILLGSQRHVSNNTTSHAPKPNYIRKTGVPELVRPPTPPDPTQITKEQKQASIARFYRKFEETTAENKADVAEEKQQNINIEQEANQNEQNQVLESLQRAIPAILGKPTSYKKGGCYKISKVHQKLEYYGSRPVSVDVCFKFCKERYDKNPPMQVFGVHAGDQCFCANLHEGSLQENCDAEDPPLSCAGDANVMCGGLKTADMYIMYDCTPPTPEEIAAAKKKAAAKVLNAYASYDEQTCGKSEKNAFNIFGSPTFVGSLEHCKNLCYAVLECHGFTFQKSEKYAAVGICSFHKNVLDGPVQKDMKIDCFYKRSNAR